MYANRLLLAALASLAFAATAGAGPTVTINQAGGQTDPTNAAPIAFTVTFSESVTGFTAGDVSLAGSTVGGSLVVTTTGSGANYTVSLTGMNGVGTVVASIPAGVATGASGSNSASTSTDNTVTFDNVRPTVTINQALNQQDPTHGAVRMSVVFSEPTTGFAGSDISFTGSTVGGTLVATVNGNGTTYEATVTGMVGVGTVVTTIPAARVTDLAGNTNTASTSTDNTVTINTDEREIDLDADGKADEAVFHDATGLWYFKDSLSGVTFSIGYGGSGYIPVPADYDGDTYTNFAVYYPPTGQWFIRSLTGATTTIGFGGVGYAPVRGDFDGDGKEDLAVFHDATGLWFIQKSSGGSLTIGYGGSGYTPVPGDYNGDGTTNLAVYHEPTGLWFIRAPGGATTTVGFGGPGYVPVRGDFDGDGRTDLAVYHEASGLWFVRNSSNMVVVTTGWGGPGFKPVPEDYDGDGKTDLAVYHEPSGVWYIKRSSDGTTYNVGLGGTGYTPVN